jgi:hypothetical protein
MKPKKNARSGCRNGDQVGDYYGGGAIVGQTDAAAVAAGGAFHCVSERPGASLTSDARGKAWSYR